MKYLVALLTLTLVACHCGHTTKPRAVVTHDAPSVVHAFHGDVEFTAIERAIIAKAVESLEYQTAGLYRPSVVYDLNYDDINSLMLLRDAALVVRMQSDYDVVRFIDEESGGEVLGMTLPHGMNGQGTNPQVYLVADRLEDPARLEHVAMHEFLHAAGLDDIGPPGSVMSGATCHMSAGLQVCESIRCMTPADVAEFCRVNHCRSDELNGCAW
jgi:hypothetical protein